MADQITKAEAVDENERLRALLEQNGIDPDTKLDPNAGIVGNLADLQRLGKQVASEGKTVLEDAFVMPASVDPDTGETIPEVTVSGKSPEDVM